MRKVGEALARAREAAAGKAEAARRAEADTVTAAVGRLRPGGVRLTSRYSEYDAPGWGR
jgi:hypothetical protein